MGGAAAALLASRAPAALAQPAPAIKRGGTFVESINWTYPSLDSHLSSQPFMAGFEAMYNTLVRFELADPKTGEQKVVGDLAESWEQPDPKTIVFKLRQGVVFHDGSSFDAEVAAWNMLRVRDHPKSQWKTQLAVLETAEALNKNTLRLKLKTPSPGFLRSMAYASGARVYMDSKVAVDKLGEDGFARNPVGTGPFRFKQWVTDDRLILERNPSYFEMGADGKPLPYLDGFVGRFVPDPTVALVDMRRAPSSSWSGCPRRTRPP
jgi:peptide/nickel transport system substrate-binding protein